MTVFRTAVAAALLAMSLLSANVHGVPAAAYQEQEFLTRVRRLTVEGRRAGEGRRRGRRPRYRRERAGGGRGHHRAPNRHTS